MNEITSERKKKNNLKLKDRYHNNIEYREEKNASL